MWIPTIMVGWGGVMVGMGFVKDFEGLLAARIFLGITEAGLFPGVSFYLTQWYKRYEISFRIALFFSAATAAGAFGGLLARLINFMDGIAGYHGWRWIFILEGILTVVVGVVSFWIMYDYPATAKFLKPAEREAVRIRLLEDSDGCSHEFKMKFVKDALLDWKIWVVSRFITQNKHLVSADISPLLCSTERSCPSTVSPSSHLLSLPTLDTPLLLLNSCLSHHTFSLLSPPSLLVSLLTDFNDVVSSLSDSVPSD